MDGARSGITPTVHAASFSGLRCPTAGHNGPSQPLITFFSHSIRSHAFSHFLTFSCSHILTFSLTIPGSPESPDPGVRDPRHPGSPNLWDSHCPTPPSCACGIPTAPKQPQKCSGIYAWKTRTQVRVFQGSLGKAWKTRTRVRVFQGSLGKPGPGNFVRLENPGSAAWISRFHIN